MGEVAGRQAFPTNGRVTNEIPLHLTSNGRKNVRMLVRCGHTVIYRDGGALGLARAARELLATLSPAST
jgi:hypothetical protein